MEIFGVNETEFPENSVKEVNLTRALKYLKMIPFEKRLLHLSSLLIFQGCFGLTVPNLKTNTFLDFPKCLNLFLFNYINVLHGSHSEKLDVI